MSISHFSAWLPPQTPSSALTETAESQIKHNFAKERILPFPSLPFWGGGRCLKQGWAPTGGAHRVGLGAAGAAQGGFVSLLWAQSHVSTKWEESWPACVVKHSSSDSSRWGPHGAQSKSAANEPNPLILCLQ